MATITARKLCEQTGATYRQIDYWCRIGILNTLTNVRGSGSIRSFDTEIISGVSLLAKVSRAFNGNPSSGLLNEVFEAHENGLSCVYLGEGVTLEWTDHARANQ